MLNGQRFSFLPKADSWGIISYVPLLPLTLNYGDRIVEVMCLLDTGASVNVLPYDLGRQLGAVWDKNTPIPLAGNLAATEATGLVLSAQIARFPPVQLVFAWTQTNNIPMILG